MKTQMQKPYHRIKRRVLLKAFENLNVISWHLYGEYSRLLRVESAGLTQAERVFFQKRVDELHQWLLHMRRLRDHIYKDLNARK